MPTPLKGCFALFCRRPLPQYRAPPQDLLSNFRQDQVDHVAALIEDSVVYPLFDW